MSLAYITGMSGSGKSTIMAYLKQLGYEVHGVDEEGYADWINRRSGKIETFDDIDPDFDIHSWYTDHDWVLSLEKITQLAHSSKEALVFLCGNAGGEEKALPLFDTVFVLRVDNETLRHRLTHRTNNDFGKHPSELDQIFKWNDDKYYEKYVKHGAIEVDGTMPTKDVVEKILTQLETKKL